MSIGVIIYVSPETLRVGDQIKLRGHWREVVEIHPMQDATGHHSMAIDCRRVDSEFDYTNEWLESAALYAVQRKESEAPLDDRK